MTYNDFRPLLNMIDPGKIPVFVLVGHPYSGKSTYLDNFFSLPFNKHPTHPGIIVLESDSYIKDMAQFENTSYDTAFERHGAEANRLYKESVKDEGNMPYDPGIIIFIDRTNMSVESRRHIIDGFWNRDVHSLIAVVFPILDDETIQERMKGRPDQFVPLEIIQSMKAKYEEPTIKEGFDKVMLVT